MLEIESPIGRRGRMAIRSDQNVLQAKIYVVSVSTSHRGSAGTR